MTVIYLIRHGQASVSADDYDQLSNKGIAQAKLLGPYLQKKVPLPTSIVTGAMARHKQTADNSLAAFALPSEVMSVPRHEDNRWNEYDHQNILKVSNAELATPTNIKQYLATKDNPAEAFKALFINAVEQWMQSEESEQYSESFAYFSQRIIAALTQIVAQTPKGNVIVYTSGGPIGLIVCHILGLPLTRFMDINWNLVNGGITKIITQGKERKLILSTLNEHDVFEQGMEKEFLTYT